MAVLKEDGTPYTKLVIDCSKPIDHPEHTKVVEMTEEEVAVVLAQQGV